MSINKDDIKVLLREFPYVARRNPDWWYSPQLPIESEYSFLDKNREAAIWLLENSSLLLEIVQKYSRVVEITNE